MIADSVILADVKARLGAAGDTPDALYAGYLAEAKALVLNYINRRSLPEGVYPLLAAITVDIIKSAERRGLSEERQGERTLRYSGDKLIGSYATALNRFRVVRTR